MKVELGWYDQCKLTVFGSMVMKHYYADKARLYFISGAVLGEAPMSRSTLGVSNLQACQYRASRVGSTLSRFMATMDPKRFLRHRIYSIEFSTEEQASSGGRATKIILRLAGTII